MDLGEYVRFLLALVFVLALIISLALLARRAGFGFPATASKSPGTRRLQVVEVTPIDGRRRMVLVRRDDVEHLLMLGPTTETIIEVGISARPDQGSFRNALQHESEATSRPSAGGTS